MALTLSKEYSGGDFDATFNFLISGVFTIIFDYIISTMFGAIHTVD